MVKFISCVLIFCLLITQLAVAQQEQTMEGRASYYGINFHGKKTANGEVFDMNEFTAAHPDLPFNSLVRVTNKTNKQSVVVRINDRGPFSKNRIIDVSKAAAEKLDMIEKGTIHVTLEVLEPPKNRKSSNE